MNEAQAGHAAAAARMKSYIAAHLQQPITAGDVARAGGYSQFHASRIFKEETGLSPFEYIRRERLLASAHALRSGRPKVLDVALNFVFGSQEGFTRAFTRSFGISPGRFSAHNRPDGWQIPFRYLERGNQSREEKTMNETSMNQTAVIFTQIIERPARKLILKRSERAEDYFAYVEEVGCGENNSSAPWDVLSEIKEALYEPAGVWLPDNMRPEGTGVYAHGVEVAANYRGEVPEGFDIIDLPPCKLIVFQGEPYDDADFERAVGVCMDRIRTFNPRVYGYEYALELAPRMQLVPEGWRGYIEMMPVREIR